MCKIALFAPNFYPDNSGYSNACTELVVALAGTNNVAVQVHVPLRNATSPPGTDVTVIPVLRGSLTRLLPPRIQWAVAQFWTGVRLRKVLRDESVDLVFVETFEYSVSLFIATVLQPWDRLRRLTVRIHATTETEFFAFSRHPVSRVLYWFAKQAAKRLPNIASTSEYYVKFIQRQWFNDNCFATFRNYLILPNTLSRRSASIRGSSQEKIELLALGRMSAAGYNQKNFELIAEAVHLIQRTDRPLFERLQITLVGDGEMLAPFQQLLARLKIDTAFRMVPRLTNPEVQQLQQSCTGALLVSRYEGISMFALECLAAGAPLIVASKTALEDLVEDGVNGFRVSSSDAAQLAGAIAKISRADLTAMSQNSRDAFAARFAPEVVVSRLLMFAEFARASRKPRRQWLT